MKTIILFCCLFVCVALAAIDTPANLGASAISHEGFTARWDAVTSATSYGLEVVEGSVQSLGSTSFENGVIPNYWVNGNVTYYNNISFANSGTYSCVFNALEDKITSPTLSNPRSISFYARASTDDASNTLRVEYSSNGSSWTELLSVSSNGLNTGTITNSYRKFNVYIHSEGDYYIRWRMLTRVEDNILVDDIAIDGGAATSGISLFSTPSTVSRISGLAPLTTYSYRIMAISDAVSSYYTSWQSIQTTASTPGSGSSTSIGGAPITIPVPSISGISNNNVVFDPDTEGDVDVSVGVAAAVRALEYTISSTNTDDLNGSYTVHHDGFIPTGINASAGNISNISIGNSSSSFTLSGLVAKGSVVVTFGQDVSLPVELSSFLVSPSETQAAIIRWQTASETGVNGYVILRSDTENIQQASIVSPLIAAMNSSQGYAYSFTDDTVQNDSWYWLLVRNLDGSEEYFGPRYFRLNDAEEIPEFVFQNALISVYPNPFNPDTQLVFSLAGRQNVLYRLFNMRGQLILQKILGQKEAGKHQIVFEGVDNAGKVLSSGMYLLELQLGTEKHYQKLLLQK